MDLKIFKNSTSDIEQRVFIKFGLLLENSAARIERDRKKALGRSAYRYYTVENLVDKYNSGRTGPNEHRGGADNIRLESKDRIEQIKDKLREYKGWTAGQLSLEIWIPLIRFYLILTENSSLNKILTN